MDDFSAQYDSAQTGPAVSQEDNAVGLNFTPEDITALQDLKAQGNIQGIGEYVANLLP